MANQQGGRTYNVVMNVAGKTVEVFVYGTIWDDSWYIKEFGRALDEAMESKPDLVELRIHSGGGSVLNAYAMITLIRKCSVPVHAYVDGLAASAATILMLAASKVFMAEMSLMMIHNPTVYAGGDENTLRKTADMLAKIKKQMTDWYVSRTGLKPSEISAMMDAETWFTPQEAVSKKFCDSVVPARYVVPKDGHEPSASAAADPKDLFNHYSITNMPTEKNNPAAFSQNPADPAGPPAQVAVTDGWVLENRAALELLLKYKDSPDERAVISRFTAVVEEATELRKQCEALKAENRLLMQQRIDALIDAALEEERITQAEAKDYRRIGDYDIIRNLLSAKKPAMRPSQYLSRVFAAPGEDRSGWDFEKWRAEDPKALSKMEQEDPEKFYALYADYKKTLNIRTS